MSWASPIRLDRAALGERQAVELVTSSPAAWTADSTQIAPDYRAHPEGGFATGEDTGRKTLAVAVEGSFESYFAGKPSPYSLLQRAGLLASTLLGVEAAALHQRWLR